MARADRRQSEQGSALLDLDPAWVGVVDFTIAAEDDHPGGDIRFVHETDPRQRRGRPRSLLGWLTDHQSTARPQQWRSAFDGLRRWPEPSGHHGVEGVSGPGLVADLLGPPAPHVDPVGEPELPGGPHQERASLPDCVEQNRLIRLAGHQDRQRRQSATRSQVDEPQATRCRPGGRICGQLVERWEKPVGVIDVIGNGTRSEEAESFRLLEYLDQRPATGQNLFLFVGSRPVAGHRDDHDLTPRFRAD